MLDDPLVPLPATGRIFRTSRRVRLGDADRSGRMRLDACARYLQDIGNDDTADSGIDDDATTWVVRRAVIDVHRPPVWREAVGLATWCSGLGGRWAGRRLALRGTDGGHVEMDTLWVHVDVATGVPARLPARFLDSYADAAGGRRITTRLWLGAAPADAAEVRWPLRAVDIDLLGHVNNAAYWAATEQVLRDAEGGAPAMLRRPHRAVIEYGPGIDPGDEVVLLVERSAERLALWFTVEGATRASVVVVPAPGPAPGGRSAALPG
jgi:acyl-ACP thioesterase